MEEAPIEIYRRLPEAESCLVPVLGIAPYRILFNTLLAIFICEHCGVALSSSEPFGARTPALIWKHFKRTHSGFQCQLSRKKFIKAINDLYAASPRAVANQSLALLKTQIADPGLLHYPLVEGLRLERTAFKCNIAGCNKCSLKVDTMRVHRRTHQAATVDGTMANMSVSKDCDILEIATLQVVQPWAESFIPVNILNPAAAAGPGLTLQECRNALSRECSPAVRDQDCNPEDISGVEHFSSWDHVLPADTAVLADAAAKIGLTQRAHESISLVQSARIKAFIVSWFLRASSTSFSHALTPYVMPDYLGDLENKDGYRVDIHDMQTKKAKVTYGEYMSRLVQFICILCGFESPTGGDRHPDVGTWRIDEFNEDEPSHADIYAAAENVWDIIDDESIAVDADGLLQVHFRSANKLMLALLCRSKLCNENSDADVVCRFLVASNTRAADGTRLASGTITTRIETCVRSSRIAMLLGDYGDRRDKGFLVCEY
jgi:hypothetical protein